MRMRYLSVLLLVVATTFYSCKKEQLNANNVIWFQQPDQENVPADNITWLKLTALIPKDSDPQTAVVFTTDLGILQNGKDNSVTVYANANGEATTYIKSGVLGLATVKATAGGTFQAVKSVNFTTPEADSIFTVAAITDVLPADGATTAKIAVSVNKDLPLASRSVVFTVDNGATFSNNAASVTITADGSNMAVAYLKSLTVGPAHLSVTCAGIVRNFVVNFVAPNPDNIFTIAPVTDHVAADGASLMLFTCTVNKDLPIANKSVSFTADNNATFSGGNTTISLNPDATGKVTAYLKSSVSGPVHVSVTSMNVTRNMTVNFDRALPDNMIISCNPSLGTGFGNSLPVSITLLKNVGKPDANFTFDYSATDSGGNPVGVFSGQTASGASGSATVNFTMGNTTYQGLITITISLKQNPAIRASANVMIL